MTTKLFTFLEIYIQGSLVHAEYSASKRPFDAIYHTFTNRHESKIASDDRILKF